MNASELYEQLQEKDKTIVNLRKYMMAYTLAVDELHGAEGSQKIKILAKELLASRVEKWSK
ncbi:hypothetical protein [Pseudolactococcus raffinolactis]|uniref:hypothetical protein n=1 Tax=Pseudolactococcus raffinolactis TaxID=1366 RepID=UPI0014368EE0|nr:hypothetical protein [Lactococcus raffinolactis]QIW51201.1 hypothetical protein GU337_04580 [Lactococcus raffinolactis]